MVSDHVAAPVHEDRPPTVTVFVAIFPNIQQALAAEHALGQLAAEGTVEVLDGELHDWPLQASVRRRRPLENLARLAALPVSVWASGSDLPIVAGNVGWSAIVAFCRTDDPGRIKAELIRAGGGTVTTRMSTDRYIQLRSGTSATSPVRAV